MKFRLGDVVHFTDEHKKRIGFIVAINKKSVKVYTTENLTWTVSPALLQLEEKPPKKVLNLMKELFPFYSLKKERK